MNITPTLRNAVASPLLRLATPLVVWGAVLLVSTAALAQPPAAQPELTQPEPARPQSTVLSRRDAQLRAPTFALDVGRVLDKTFAVSYGVARSATLEVGGVFAAGSPDRVRLDRFNVAELGAYASWFGMGDRGRGVGLTARARYLYAWGSGETETGGELSTSAHAGSASGLVTARYTTIQGLRLELQGGLMWLSSRSTARAGDTEETSALNVPLTTVNFLMGWTF